MVFQKFSKAKFGVKVVECVTFFWLVSGEITGQGSRTFVLSLKLPSSTGVWALVPAELRYIAMYTPRGKTRTSTAALFVLITVAWSPLFCFYISPLFWLATVWICLPCLGRCRRLKPRRAAGSPAWFPFSLSPFHSSIHRVAHIPWNLMHENTTPSTITRQAQRAPHHC